MTSTDYPPRLAVVASIIDECSPVDASLAAAGRIGSDLQGNAASATQAEPTPQERALAEALQEDDQNDGPPTDRAIAELLLLVDDVPAADDLATGLSQTFLLPEDSRPALAREERHSAFADLYRRLALHHLNSQVRNKAAAKLRKLIRR